MTKRFLKCLYTTVTDEKLKPGAINGFVDYIPLVNTPIHCFYTTFQVRLAFHGIIKVSIIN